MLIRNKIIKFFSGDVNFNIGIFLKESSFIIKEIYRRYELISKNFEKNILFKKFLNDIIDSYFLLYNDQNRNLSNFKSYLKEKLIIEIGEEELNNVFKIKNEELENADIETKIYEISYTFKDVFFFQYFLEDFFSFSLLFNNLLPLSNFYKELEYSMLNSCGSKNTEIINYFFDFFWLPLEDLKEKNFFLELNNFWKNKIIEFRKIDELLILIEEKISLLTSLITNILLDLNLWGEKMEKEEIDNFFSKFKNEDSYKKVRDFTFFNEKLSVYDKIEIFNSQFYEYVIGIWKIPSFLFDGENKDRKICKLISIFLPYGNEENQNIRNRGSEFVFLKNITWKNKIIKEEKMIEKNIKVNTDIN